MKLITFTILTVFLVSACREAESRVSEDTKPIEVPIADGDPNWIIDDAQLVLCQSMNFANKTYSDGYLTIRFEGNCSGTILECGAVFVYKARNVIVDPAQHRADIFFITSDGGENCPEVKSIYSDCPLTSVGGGEGIETEYLAIWCFGNQGQELNFQRIE